MKFVLVHGARGSGQTWKDVAEILTRKGHAAICPTLRNPAQSSLREHAIQVAEIVQNCGSGKIVLVGHSYGGMVISEAALASPQSILCMHYLDAAVSLAGESLFSMIEQAGFDPVRDFQIDPFAPFHERSKVDWETLRAMPKFYTQCTKSGFNEVICLVTARLKKGCVGDNWQIGQLNCGHVMARECPQETATILLDSIKTRQCTAGNL